MFELVLIMLLSVVVVIGSPSQRSADTKKSFGAVSQRSEA
jgi:hypothetical protein